MTNEIMPKEDRMEKILSFIGGCIAGVAGVFAVAVMSEMASTDSSSDSSENETDEQAGRLSPQRDGCNASGN